MPPSHASEAEINSLHVEIQRRLIESGEWERIKAILSAKLNETGWTDDLRHRSKENARTMEPLSFQTLLEKMSPHAQTSIPLAVRSEVKAAIRQYLEKEFE